MFKREWPPVPTALESTGLTTRIVTWLVLTRSGTRKKEYGNELHQSTSWVITTFVGPAHGHDCFLFCVFFRVFQTFNNVHVEWF